MKPRVLATLVAVLVWSIGTSSAQPTIGMFTDTGSSTCEISAPAYVQTDFYINTVDTHLFLQPAGFTGAEFRIEHDISPAEAILSVVPNPAANVLIGDVLGDGVNIAFPTCQVGCSITLFSGSIVVLDENAVHNEVLNVRSRIVPTNPGFQCPLITMCDAPLYTALCVTGFFASINHDFSPCIYHEGDIDPPWIGPNCNVAVEQTSWSGVKELFR